MLFNNNFSSSTTSQNRALYECLTEFDSPVKMSVHLSGSKVLLWAKHQTLHWKFKKVFPNSHKSKFRGLLIKAMNLWGDSAPIRIKEVNSNPDFEIEYVSKPYAGRLMNAFFPNEEKNVLQVYDLFFSQGFSELVLAHELGHIFGLRHSFSEDESKPSVIVLPHKKWGKSIMNPRHLGFTHRDKKQLTDLYHKAWGRSGYVNSYPIRLVRTYNSVR